MKHVTAWISVLTVILSFAPGAMADDTFPITFQVDMTAAINACQLIPNNPDHRVQVRGSFPGTTWGNDAATLARVGDSNIYSIVINVPVGNYEYKFVLWKGGDNVTWEDNPPGSNNRPLAVSGERVIDPVNFNKAFENACGAQPRKVEIEFAVDMEVWINGGDFNPETDFVVVAGTFNGWTMSDTLQSSFLNPNIYSKIVRRDDLLVPSTIMFKFVTGTRGAAPSGWEGGADRQLQITGTEPVQDDYLQVTLDPIPYFNRVTLDDVFTVDGGATLRLVVDARAATYHLKHFGFVPSDVQTREEVRSWSNVFINGPMSRRSGDPVGDWADWGPENLGQLEGRRLVFNAQDSVFVWERTFRRFQPRRQVFKLGLDGYDNENGFGADHTIIIPDEANPTVRIVFGATKTDAVASDLRPNEFGYRVDLYSRFIQFTSEGTPVPVRTGGVNVEPTYGELPETISLSQNYPNPFNPSTTFEYAIASTQHVTVRVFDALGREVATLVDGVQTANTYQVTFDASNLPSGLYLYQVQAGGQVATRTMMLVK